MNIESFKYKRKTVLVLIITELIYLTYLSLFNFKTRSRPFPLFFLELGSRLASYRFLALLP